MQVWYYTNLNQLIRVNNVNNTSYVRQDAYKFKSTRKPCKIPKISGSHHQFKQFFCDQTIALTCRNMVLNNCFGFGFHLHFEA